MDGISHSAWSYLLWRNDPLVWGAVAAGILPDVIGFVPCSIASGIKNRSWKALFYGTNPPKWARVYKNAIYPVTHSTVVALAVWGAVSAVWGMQWWLLAWPLHTVFDIVSHPRDNTAPFLYPLSRHKVHGLAWYTKQFMVINVIAFALVAFVLLR